MSSGIVELTEGMYLYHYSTSKLKTISTRRKRKDFTKDEDRKFERMHQKHKTPGSYLDHVSVFMEPLDIDRMSSFFDDHPFWRKGTVVYEHVIPVEEFDRAPYMVVETSADMFLYDNVTDWLFDNFTGTYFTIKSTISKMFHQGKGTKDLIATIDKFKGETMRGYEEVGKNKEHRGSDKYAARVPHLMVYPVKGEVTPSITRKLIVG